MNAFACPMLTPQGPPFFSLFNIGKEERPSVAANPSLFHFLIINARYCLGVVTPQWE